MKKEFLIVTALVVAATGILFALNLTSGKPNTHNNGFTRNIKHNALKEEAKLDLPKGVTRFCNISNDTVYLQTSSPDLIYYTCDFKKLDTMKLNVPDLPGLKKRFSTTVNYPIVNILAGNIRKVIQINLSTKEQNIIDLEVPGSCINPAYIDANTLVTRVIDTVTLNAFFVKIDLREGRVTREKKISQLLGDAGFTHDGILNYDESTYRFAYSNYYSNSIIIFDTTLNTSLQYKTVDTVSNSNIQLRIMTGDTKSVTFKAPPKIINGTSTAANGSLFIRSYLQGNNEQDFDNNYAIDRYDLISGNYVESYYWPLRRQYHLIELKKTDNHLVALFDKKLLKIKIVEP